MEKKPKATSHRLSTEAKRLLHLLATHFGVSMTAVLELIIRQAAQREGLWPPG